MTTTFWKPTRKVAWIRNDDEKLTRKKISKDDMKMYKKMYSGTATEEEIEKFHVDKQAKEITFHMSQPSDSKWRGGNRKKGWQK